MIVSFVVGYVLHHTEAQKAQKPGEFEQGQGECGPALDAG